MKDSNIICSLDKFSDTIFSKVEDNLKKIIADQVTKNQESQIEKVVEKFVTQHQTYAELVKKDIAKEIAQQSAPGAIDLKKIMKETRKEEEQEKEKKDRLSNLIIHGVKEVNDEANSCKKNDEEFISSFLITLEVNVKQKHCFRIGQPKNEKTN